MAKSKNESNNKNSGTLLTEKDGTQYFVMGKVRIKVSEHFAQDGKPLDSLLEDVIQQIVGKCNRVINESMPIDSSSSIIHPHNSGSFSESYQWIFHHQFS